MKQNNMRSGSRPSLEGTRLLFGGGMVSPMMWPADGQQKDDKKCQTEDKPRWGQRQSRKNKSRPQRGGGLSLNLYLPGVSRWTGVISYPISCEITTYDISRDCIHIPIFFWMISRYRIPSKYSSIPNTFLCPLLGAPSLVHQESKRNNGYLVVETQKQWYLLEKYIRTPTWGYAVGRLGCRALSNFARSEPGEQLQVLLAVFVFGSAGPESV